MHGVSIPPTVHRDCFNLIHDYRMNFPLRTIKNVRQGTCPDHRMKSTVYFVNVKDADDIAAGNDQLKTLPEKSSMLDVIHKIRKVGVKPHFGEEGSTGFVRRDHMRVICDEILRRGAGPSSRTRTPCTAANALTRKIIRHWATSTVLARKRSERISGRRTMFAIFSFLEGSFRAALPYSILLQGLY